MLNPHVKHVYMGISVDPHVNPSKPNLHGGLGIYMVIQVPDRVLGAWMIEFAASFLSSKVAPNRSKNRVKKRTRKQLRFRRQKCLKSDPKVTQNR